MILQKLAKLANVYDKMGQTKKADRLDEFINKWAQEDKEPTMEDLMGEEEWLKEEGITTDDGDEGDEGGETYFEEDILEGLDEPDQEVASNYLNSSTEDIASMLRDLENQKNKIMQELSKLQGFEPEITNLPLTPEASLMRDFEKLATALDKIKFHKHASFFDHLLTKLAQGVPPNDLFDDTDADDFGLAEEINEDTVIEDPEQVESEMMEFLHTLADGEVASLEEAQSRARDILASHSETDSAETAMGTITDMADIISES